VSATAIQSQLWLHWLPLSSFLLQYQGSEHSICSIRTLYLYCSSWLANSDKYELTFLDSKIVFDFIQTLVLASSVEVVWTRSYILLIRIANLYQVSSISYDSCDSHLDLIWYQTQLIHIRVWICFGFLIMNPNSICWISWSWEMWISVESHDMNSIMVGTSQKEAELND